MKAALTSLPCVEPKSVSVDINTKQARFRAKKDEKIEIAEVKEAVAKMGPFTVTDVKLPTNE